jgi:ketosteroid isomerase-like protein
VRTYWRRWLQAWADIEFEVDDVLDAGDDVVALIRSAAVGTSQWHRDGHTANGLVFTIRDGKVARLLRYAVRAQSGRAERVGDHRRRAPR